jgi:hypothetical protein
MSRAKGIAVVDDAEQVVEEGDEDLQRHPLVHRLMEKLPTVVLQYIPIAGPALSGTLDAIYADRLRTFYTELAAGEHELNPRLIDSEDFLHAYFATVQAAARTKHRDKIRSFARLLRAAAREEIALESEYEDYLQTLDDLSYRELCLLTTLASFEQQHPKHEDETHLARVNAYWEVFVQAASDQCGVRPEELDSMMLRLVRTGTYMNTTGMYADGETRGGKGELTSFYYRLAAYVDLHV